MPCLDWSEGFLNAFEQIPGETNVDSDKKVLEKSEG